MAVRWSGRRLEVGDGVWPHTSGEQWRIGAGEAQATIVSVGGGLREFLVADQPIVAGYHADAVAPAAAGQVLAPWPNRIAGGTYRFDGYPHQLPITEAAGDAAIHGMVRWLVWEQLERRDDEVVVGCTLPPQPGYPWPLRLSTRWTVSSDGLRAVHSATNLGRLRCPFGLGVHPYVWVPGVPVSELTLRLPMALAGEPAEAVMGTEYDFMTGRPIGTLALDTPYGRPLPDADGTVRTQLTAADGRGVEVWQDGSFGWTQIYTGPGPTGRAGDTVAVEPMTCPPQAFRTGEDVVVLEPGDTWSGSWGVRPVR